MLDVQFIIGTFMYTDYNNIWIKSTLANCSHYPPWIPAIIKIGWLMLTLTG